MGVDLFKQPKQNLIKAKKILINYKDFPQAQQLLNLIEQLQNRK